MPLRVTEHFDGVTKLFHWTMAILIIGMVVVGLYMTDLPNSPDKFTIYAWHKTIGMTILALVVLRLLWRMHSPRPRPLATHHPIEMWLAHIVHIALYLCMFLMPISGYVMSSASGFAFNVWGWTVPMLVPANHDVAEAAEEAHEIISNVLIGAVLLHVAGALKHHVLDRDATLTRMLPAILTPRRKSL